MGARMTAPTETKATTLAGALVLAQAEMPPVPKTKEVKVATRTGGEFTYKYATLDDLIAATLPVLNRHGLAIVQLPAQTETGMPGLRTVIVHESGEELSATMPLSPGNGMQELGSAITYMRRYAWSAALGIASEHDDDGQASSHGSSDASDAVRAAQAAQPLVGDEWRWPFGKNKGLTLEETPASYLEWFLANGTDESIKDRVRAFNGQAELVTAGGFVEDDSIPFAPTIDGLGG